MRATRAEVVKQLRDLADSVENGMSDGGHLEYRWRLEGHMELRFSYGLGDSLVETIDSPPIPDDYYLVLEDE